MVRRYIEKYGNIGFEVLDEFHLKTGYFQDPDPFRIWIFQIFQDHGRERDTDVAGQYTMEIIGLDHFGQQMGSRGFTVATRNGQDWRFSEPAGKFDLADNRYAVGLCFLH